MRKWLSKSGLNLAFVVIVLSIIYVALFPDVIDASHGQSQNKFLSMMDHAAHEFFDMGKYLIIGSIITAAHLITTGFVFDESHQIQTLSSGCITNIELSNFKAAGCENGSIFFASASSTIVPSCITSKRSQKKHAALIS